MPNKLLRVADVADSLGVSTSTVYRLSEHGKIAHVKVGGQCRFTLEMIDDYIANATVDSKRSLGRPHKIRTKG